MTTPTKTDVQPRITTWAEALALCGDDIIAVLDAYLDGTLHLDPSIVPIDALLSRQVAREVTALREEVRAWRLGLRPE